MVILKRNNNLISEAEKDEDSVIVKVGNKWRIKGNKVKYID